MPDLVKQRQEEEERKRREAQQAAKPPVVKPAQAAAKAEAEAQAKAAAVRTSAAAASTTMPKSNGYKVSINNALGANANAAETSTLKADFSTLKTPQQVANVAMRISTDSERDDFLSAYRKHAKKQGYTNLPTIEEYRTMVDSGSKSGVYAKTVAERTKSQQAIRSNMGTLGGLYDVNGRAININTASYATVVQGIRSIADKGKRKAAAKALKALTEEKGSRFFGQTVDEDLLGSYLGNPDFTQETYDDEVERFQNVFYPQSGYEKQNNEAYLSFYEDILGSGYSETIQRQLLEALDTTYKNATGKTAAPDVSALIRERDEGVPAQNPTENGEDQSAWDKVTGWIGSVVEDLFGGDEEPKPEEEKPEEPDQTPTPAPTPAPTSTPNPEDIISGVKPVGVYASATVSDVPVPQPLQPPPGAEASGIPEGTTIPPEVQGPQQQAKPGYMGFEAWLASGGYQKAKAEQQQGAEDEPEPEGYIDVRDDSDVIGAMRMGLWDRVREEDRANVEGYMKYKTARQIMGMITDEQLAKEVETGNRGAELAQVASLGALGSTAYAALEVIMSEDYPAELQNDGYAIMISLAARAEQLAESGQLGGDESLPIMERLLTTDEYAMEQLGMIYTARDTLEAERTAQRTQQEQATQQALKEAREAVLRGEASDEQIAMVTQYAEADWKDVQNDDMRATMHAQINRTFFTGTYPKFYETSVYKNLQSYGIIDSGSYQSALKGQMEAIIDEDTEAALSLGMTLEEYYDKIGGMDLETICQRAATRMSQQGYAITPEEQEVLDATYGEGISNTETAVLGVKRGTADFVGKYADSLYMGLSEGNVIRTAAQMKNTYETEFGVMGRTMYRRDLEALIESGTLPESYAKALGEVLSEATDVYDVGIDPEAFGGLRSLGSGMRESVEQMDLYVRENGTEGQNRAYMLLSSATSNAWMAGTAALGTAITGSANIGFALGYDVVGWGENFNGYLDQGFKRGSAASMASIATGAAHLANVGTFSSIFGKASGATTMEQNALIGMLAKNPAGVAKGFAATKAYALAKAGVTFAGSFVKNTFEEAVKDEAVEGIVQSYVDRAIAPLFRRADAGERIGFSDVMDALLNVEAIDLKGVAKNVKANFIDAAITSSLFSFAGAFGEGVSQYRSVQWAKEVISGKNTNVEGWVKMAMEDLGDEGFRIAIDEEAAQQRMDAEVVMTLATDDGKDGKKEKAKKAQEQADAHAAAANASGAAMASAVSTMQAAQAKIDSGEADQADEQMLRDAQEAFVKDKTGFDEHTREAQQKAEEAKTARREKYQLAQAKAAQRIAQEDAAALEHLAMEQQSRILQQEADNVTALEASNFVDERYNDATDQHKQKIIDQYISAVREKVNPDFKSVDMAVRQFKKKFKNINFTVVDSLFGTEGGYVRDRNTVYIARDMTYGEIANRVITHELTHAAESGGRAYDKLRDALINLRYEGDQGKLRADIESKINRYNDYFIQNNILDNATGEVKQLTEEEAVQEIVAQINSEILSGNEEMINRLVAEEPSAARRIWEAIKDFLQKVGVIKDTEIDQLRRVEKMFEKALNQAQTRLRDFGTDGIQYSLREKQPPKNVVYAYKAFYARDGKLYPPMVANITDESDKQKVKGATSGTMKSLPTPVGVWLDADVGGIMTDENGEPVRAKDTKRLRVKNDKSGGSATLAFRPGWHLGEWPDAKQFNKADPETGERGKRMPDDLVFAKCEVSADIDYQLDALSYGINEKGGFSRSQAGLPEIPEDGYYKYRTNVDPTTAPWLIAGSIKITEILDDDDCARICAEFGVTPDKRVSGEKIDLAKYGLKRGPVEETTEGMEKFRENDANRANKALLVRALSDPNYSNAYVKRDIDFDNPAQYEQLKKEFAMNGQDIEHYRKLYEARGFATERPVANDVVERYANEANGMQFSVGYNDDAYATPKEDDPDRFDYVLPGLRVKNSLKNALSKQEFETLKGIIENKPKEYMEMRNFKKGRIKTAAITYHGDNTKMVCMKATPYSYDIQDVYELNTGAYDGRITDLVKAFEKGMRYYETERFERSYRRFADLYGFELFRKYDPETGEYVGIDPERTARRKDDSSKRTGLERKPDGGRSFVGDGESDGGVISRMQLSLPSEGVLTQEIQAYHALQNQPEPEQARQIPNQDQQPKPQGERQFVVKTLQESPAVPQWAKDAMYNNPEARFYEKDANNDQIVRSWERLQNEGYEAMRDRVLSSDAQNPDNIADANMVLAVANREGDMKTFLDVALHYAIEGTKTGKALQARKIFSRMTPTGMRIWAAGQSESNLAKYIDEHKPVKRKVDRAAKKVAEKIKDLQGGDELLRLQAASEYTVTAEDARYGIPINEKQRALIKEYGLEKVARPGINYNRATLKQRMLEAILAEPNPENVTGNGLNLLQRLEFMKEGAAVITNADLDYIGEQMVLYAHSPVDDQEGRIGDLALARLYEAYGNITPATAAEKLKTWRYTATLFSLPSSIRNVIGNAAQNTVNATAHGVAHVIDWGVSKVTGERTIAGLTMKERADGWAAFVEETKNTFRDFYTDKAITSHGEDRHNLNQRGRVYQNGTLEMMRLTEGFLMSVGDRNFWKKAYVNSLAEQQRVADLNGEAFDYEAACERAEAEANYATFNEDSRVRDFLAQLKNPPEDAPFKDKVIAMAVDFLMPFTGVPTNITKRMIDYSPAGLAFTAIEHGVKAAQGKNFDQNAFVNGMARGLTGTALLAIGMELFKAGLVSLGTGEEEDKKIYGAETAQGRQYTPYIRVGDQYIALSTFMPAASAIIMGATAQKIFENDEDALNAIKSACFASLDMIFDASYMSSLADIFGGYGTLGENAVDSLLNSMISQNVPAILGQIASTMDPYVRDTKDKNVIMQALKSGLIAKLPFLRDELLEAKVDITGEKVRNSKQYVALIDPFTRSYANDDPVLEELIDFARESGDSGVIPELFVAGNKFEVKVTKTQAKSLRVNFGVGENGKREYQALTLSVTDEEKWDLNEQYGKLVFSELRKLMSSGKWKRADEKERIALAKEVIKDTKLDVLEGFLKERGVK